MRAIEYEYLSEENLKEGFGNINLSKLNRAFIRGSICTELEYSHTAFEINFYKVIINVKRLSDQSDFIPVIISEELFAKEKLKEFQIGKNIEIVGEFRSINYRKNGKSQVKLFLFAKAIKFCKENVEVSEKDPNVIFVNGFSVKEPIYRFTPLKKEITELIIAVNERKRRTVYLPCIAWGDNAKLTSNLEVGIPISFYGRIQSRCYQKQGENYLRRAYEVSIADILSVY